MWSNLRRAELVALRRGAGANGPSFCLWASVQNKEEGKEKEEEEAEEENPGCSVRENRHKTQVQKAIIKLPPPFLLPPNLFVIKNPSNNTLGRPTADVIITSTSQLD